MPLTAGTHLGSYEVVAPLGAGGMGEVYRARDTRLNREVAIKILSEMFISDPDRVARFAREAKTLAALNHPNIAAIHGLEESNGISALVLELVEGPTLADRIAQGPILLDEALPIAGQIVDALEAAHEQGIIHRDLKPANIKLRADGTVKVLDFGLARTVETAAAASTLSNSPTFSVHATQAGVILGTAAYMAPEQAKGLLADHRSDIFAFGVVLYEMLTGRNPFQGDTTPEILASVLVREPDLTALPLDLNPRIGELLRRCLNKNPKKRWQAVGDLRIELEAIAERPRVTVDAPRVEQQPRPRRAFPVALTALATAAFAGMLAWMLWPTAPPTPIVGRYVFPLGEGQNFTNTGRHGIAISPDGTRMVYVANTRLYLRSMSELEARPIPGTESTAGVGAVVTSPVFSPDGQTIVFWSGTNQSPGTLKRIAVTGGAAVTLAQTQNPYGLSWIDDDIFVGQGANGIIRVPASGGKPETVITLTAEERASGPQMLPGKQAVLFTLLTGTSGDWDRARIVVQQLRTGERKTILEVGSDARYLPSGHIVYAVGGTVFGFPFDLRRLAVLGSAVPLIEGVRRAGNIGAAQFSTSSAGSLVYIPGPLTPSAAAVRDIVLADRKGNLEPLKLVPGPYDAPRISPNGTQIVFSTDDGKAQAIWIYGVSGTAAPRQLTVGGNNRFPLWSSDGRHVAFQSDREGDFAIYWQLADGTAPAERLTRPEKGGSHAPESWLPRGDTLLFRVATEQNKFNLWTLSTQDKKATLFVEAQSTNPPNAVFSPDGHWVAYYSDESGDATLWLRPFPATEVTYQLGPDGDSHHPLWSPDGRELLYIPGFNLLRARTISTHPAFSFSNPVQVPVGQIVIANPTTHRSFDITREGKIVALRNAATPGTPTTPQVNVVLNWFEELKRLVPTN